MPVMPAFVSSSTNIHARPLTDRGIVESWNGALAWSYRRVVRIFVIFKVVSSCVSDGYSRFRNLIDLIPALAGKYTRVHAFHRCRIHSVPIGDTSNERLAQCLSKTNQLVSRCASPIIPSLKSGISRA